jgi:dienelactone hydrolase
MSSRSSIDIAVDDGTFSCFAARPATPGPHPVIIVLHHAFARPGGSHFHAGDAALANARTDAFFKRHLAPANATLHD